MPALDIAESDAAFTLTAALPRMTERDIQLSLSGDTLTIRGEKRQEWKRRRITISARSYGAFQRAFVWPDGTDREKIAAEFANGVLTVACASLTVRSGKIFGRLFLGEVGG